MKLLRRGDASVIGGVHHVRVQHRGEARLALEADRFHQHVSKLGARKTIAQNAGVVEIHENIVDRPLDSSATHHVDRGLVREQIDQERSDGQCRGHEDKRRTDHHQTERTETVGCFGATDHFVFLVRTRNEKDAIDNS